MNRLEAELQDSVVEAVGFCECFNVMEHDVNPLPGGYLDKKKTGVPDLQIVGYKEDRVFWIELKTAKGKLSRRQKDWHARYRHYNGSVYVCRSVLEVLRTLKLKADEYGWRDQRLDALIRGLTG